MPKQENALRINGMAILRFTNLETLLGFKLAPQYAYNLTYLTSLVPNLVSKSETPT